MVRATETDRVAGPADGTKLTIYRTGIQRMLKNELAYDIV